MCYTRNPMLNQQLSQLKDLLKIHYGYSEFRFGQEKAIKNVLEQKSTVVIMPTGGGKSLIYQLPSLILDGITIVISPLIALMKDQVDSLEQIGIPATFIGPVLRRYGKIALDIGHIMSALAGHGEVARSYISEFDY